MTKNAQTLHELFRRKYAAGLVLIAILAGASLFVFFDQTSHQAGRAELVGLASTQKALSQRVAFFANELEDADAAARETMRAELRAAIDQMRKAHAVLSGAEDASARMRRHLATIRDIYFNEDAPLDEEVKAFLGGAERLLDETLTAEETGALISEINLLGMHTIMQTHDVIARIITYEAERAIVRTNVIQMMLMTLIILLLAVESIFIFEPMGRKIEESVRRAETSEQNAIAEAARARAADAAKTNFLRMMSHELRTPLNAVIGLTNLLKTTRLNDKQGLYAEHIESAGRHMLSIANDILTINQHAAGRMKIAPAPANLGEELKAIVELMSPKAAELGLLLAAEVDEALEAPYEIDAARLRQVIYNLVGNALKFTPQGSVRLAAAARPAAGDHADIEIRVIDTGVGVPADKREKIFEEFEQAHQLGERSYGGAGLGLAISRRIVEAMGGTLTLESTGAEGSTFLVSLRLRPCAPAAAPEAKAPLAAAPEQEPAAVLVVDDNLPNRMIAGAFLARAGCDVVYAENGREALEAWAKNGAFSIIFMDIEMPVMDGLAATKELRARQARGDKRTPVIALTAHALPEDTDNLLASGFDEVLRKPASEEELVECMRRHCGRRQAA